MSGGNATARNDRAGIVVQSQRVLLADEPTTALDVTVQIQILLLLRELQREFGMAVMFVTHDVGAAVEVSDRLAVMYAGRFVETGNLFVRAKATPHTPIPKACSQQICTAPSPVLGSTTISGAPPNLSALPQGCSFAPRCTHALDGCRKTIRPSLPVAMGTSRAAYGWRNASGLLPDTRRIAGTNLAFRQTSNWRDRCVAENLIASPPHPRVAGLPLS